jgi:hypothetical protein
MTVDKIVFQMRVNETFRPLSVNEKQQIKSFGKREGVYISDFDGFMPNGNPIINAKELSDPAKDA